MSNFDILEPAVNPNNRISFLLDWELTMKCNLDCSYCPIGLYGGHDNSTKHPETDKCINTIDFMFSYIDLYMQQKPKGIRYVILNVYGGESLHHPDIVKILSAVHDKYQKYKDRWHLTVTTTTNAILSKKKLHKIIPYIDEFTVSYHTNNTEKQKHQFKENLLEIAKSGRRQKCIVLMHADPVLFADASLMIEWLQKHNIKHLPRQLDHAPQLTQFKYEESQVKWFDNLYKEKSYNTVESSLLDANFDDKVHLGNLGRACCGGRQVCKDKNYKTRHFFIENKFSDWHCSVNHFFLYVKQVNGEIYVNRDCKMNFEGNVGPIGNLTNANEILLKLKNQLDTDSLPVIQCKKESCLCGICAPKAKNLGDYKKIMEKYQLKL